MDEHSWQDNLEDAVDLARVVKGAGKEVIAQKVIKAYVKSKMVAATAVLTVPLVTGSVAPTISNVPVRKPDENLPAQSQPANVISEGSAIFVRTASTSSSAGFVMETRPRK